MGIKEVGMTTQTYNVREAKANLPRLLEEVASGLGCDITPGYEGMEIVL